jgi:hypothetical protein
MTWPRGVSRPRAGDGWATDDEALGRAIAAAVPDGAAPEDLAERLLATLGPHLTEIGRDRGPAPALWLLPPALAGVALVLLALAQALGLPVGSAVAALWALGTAWALALGEAMRLSTLPACLVALGVAVALFPRLRRTEVDG